MWVLRLFSPAGDGTGRGFSYFILPDSTRSLDTGTRRSWLSFTTFLRTGREPPVLGGPRRGRIATGLGRVRRPTRGRLLAAFRSLTCVVTTATRRAFGPRVIRTRIRPLAGAECAPNSNRGREAGTFRHDVPAPGRTQACHAHLASAENRSSETGRTEQMAVWTLRPVSEGHLTGVGRPV